MHAREIEKWKGRITQRGYSLVPLRIYFKNGRVKLELGLGKGKKEGDEREKIKREVELKEAREIMQARRGRR
jgi:SsrA-binding protein